MVYFVHEQSVDEWWVIDTFVVAEHTGVRVEHKVNSVFLVSYPLPDR